MRKWNGTTTLEKNLAISFKINIYLSSDPEVSLFGSFSEKHLSTKDLYKNFIAALFMAAPNWRKTPNVHWQKNEETNFVYSLNEILLSNKNEPTTDTFNNMSESQKHYAEWNFTQKRTSCMIPLYEILWQKKLVVGEKKIRTTVTSRMGWQWGLTRKSRGKLFWLKEIFCILIGVLVTWVYAFVKSLWMEHLRFVCFTICKFYLQKKIEFYNIDMNA